MMELNQALGKVFSSDKELLRKSKNEYLEKVCEMSGVNKHDQEIETLNFALCEEVVDILYATHESFIKSGLEDRFYERVKRTWAYIFDILIQKGFRKDVITENLIYNIFSIIDFDVRTSDKDSPDDKIKSDVKPHEIHEINVIINSSSSGAYQDNKKEDKKRKDKKSERMKPPEFYIFYISFVAIMLFWIISSVVSIYAMIRIVATEDIVDINLLISGGIVVLLLVGAKFILPLLTDSFNFAVKMETAFNMSERYDVETFKIVINALKDQQYKK